MGRGNLQYRRPGADDCESPTLICNVPPLSFWTNNASGSNATGQTTASGDKYFLKGHWIEDWLCLISFKENSCSK